MDIRVLLEYDEEASAYSATCPELNFVSSCGETKEEAVSNLQEAIKLLLTPIPENLLGTSGPVETIHLAL
jgi:predicted RNase H-like HicB family nuclease